MNGIEQAIEKAGGGLAGAKAVAAALTPPVSHEFIYKCKRKGWLPTDRARQVSDLYGIPLIDLVKADVRAAILAAQA